MKSLTTTTSRLAIAAAAGLLMGGLSLSPAQAADLGGDCCADLEERVAELEATTVRKGNRRMSVRLSGQVNYSMVYWDDGGESDVYIFDNTESNTRFRFTGAAKFKPGWSTGFVAEISMVSAAGSAADQVRDGDNNENADGTLGLRLAAWYMKSDRLGEIWMGRYSPATDNIKFLNTAGGPWADSTTEVGAGFFLRAPGGTGGCAGSGCLYNLTLGAITPGGDTRRGEVIRYNTPSLLGMVFSVSWGEDDIFDVAVRYRKEWNSIRVVGGIGYHWDTDETEADNNAVVCAGVDPRFGGAGTAAPGDAGILNTSINNPGVAVGANLLQADGVNAACRRTRYDIERLAGSAGAMHTPSGLFGHVAFHTDTWKDFSAFARNGGTVVDQLGAAANISGTRSIGGDTEPNTGRHLYLQAGIQRRMGPLRDLGRTTLFAEWQKWDGWREGVLSNQFGPSNAAAGLPGGSVNNLAIQNAINATLGLPAYASTYVGGGGTTGAFPANGTIISSSEVTSWGFGMAQNIDAASMQLWLTFRKFDPDIRTQTVFNAGIECAAPFPNAQGGCTAHPRQLPGMVVENEVAIEDIYLINFGGRLRF